MKSTFYITTLAIHTMVSIWNRLLEPILIFSYKYLYIYLTYSFLDFKKCRFGTNFKVENNFLISLTWEITVSCLEHHVYENGFAVLLLLNYQ